MNNNEYQKNAEKFNNPSDSLSVRLSNKNIQTLLHAQMGISGEAGELADVIKKHIMYGKELDVNHIKEECGDVLWYMSILLTEIGANFNEIMEINIKKLSKRYPNGFSEADALDRKDKR